LNASLAALSKAEPTRAHGLGHPQSAAGGLERFGRIFTSTEFRAKLTTLRMRASMGRVGSCFDNAVAESFFADLEGRDRHPSLATRAEARRAVFAYLSYYNQHRLHSTLKRSTPYEARVCYRQRIALAA
jgi:Integrase core domain